jgi:hypothetical protein
MVPPTARKRHSGSDDGARHKDASHNSAPNVCSAQRFWSHPTTLYRFVLEDCDISDTLNRKKGSGR